MENSLYVCLFWQEQLIYTPCCRAGEHPESCPSSISPVSTWNGLSPWVQEELHLCLSDPLAAAVSVGAQGTWSAGWCYSEFQGKLMKTQIIKCNKDLGFMQTQCGGIQLIQPKTLWLFAVKIKLSVAAPLILSVLTSHSSSHCASVSFWGDISIFCHHIQFLPRLFWAHNASICESCRVHTIPQLQGKFHLSVGHL